jgi:hypothetical protein
MTRLFRAMRKDANGFPEVGPNARALGVRPGVDIPAILPDELVQPGQGGLSVSPDDPLNLPYFRRPAGFQGTGKDPVWAIDSDRLGPDLCFRSDSGRPDHGFIEPIRTMTLDEYHSALFLTKKSWEEVQPSP